MRRDAMTLLALMSIGLGLGGRPARAQEAAFHPLLGASAEPRVEVAWNRLHDHAGIEDILRRLHRAFPSLTRLSSLGRSFEGRDLWCLEVSNREQGDPDRKPGMWIDGNIHGNEVQGAEAVLYTAWYLLHQHGRLDKVTELVDERVFYLVPTINPDGRDSWLESAHTNSSSRTGRRPFDNDRDGLLDEDDDDDLDGDGQIARMRRRDPHGRWKPDPEWPDVMLRCEPDEACGWELLGWEGKDDDGDGRVNEDGPGGYDPNRDWAWDWQPGFVQHGALEYPFSLPESRAVKDFVLSRPNIAGAQSYHNAGGMILRGPGREGGEVQEADERVLAFIGSRGEEMLPFYRSMVIWKDLYTVWGGEIDWFYGARGIFAFSNELWRDRMLTKSEKGPDRAGSAAFRTHVLLGDGTIPWKPFEHPTYGPIEIGGTRKEWGRTPPSFMLEEECHRNMAFTLYHADQLPRIAIASVESEAIAPELHRVWVTVENTRILPTRSAQDVEHHLTPPDVVRAGGAGLEVISAGRVTDRDFRRVVPVERRPERVEIDAVGGFSAERVQFIVAGSGTLKVSFDSVKGGHREQSVRLR